MNESRPSPMVPNGRRSNGQFGPGHGFSRGNPNAKRVAALRRAYLKSIKPSDLADVAKAVLAAAKGGDIGAAKELCDRLLGRPAQQDLLERLENLEATLSDRAKATTPRLN